MLKDAKRDYITQEDIDYLMTKESAEEAQKIEIPPEDRELLEKMMEIMGF